MMCKKLCSSAFEREVQSKKVKQKQIKDEGSYSIFLRAQVTLFR